MWVFVVLGLIWAAVLLPPLFRARAARREKFIESFKQQMGALDNRRARATEVDRKAGRPRRPHRTVSPAQRRRDILGGMLGALMGSLVLGLFPSLRMVWVLHLFLLNLFIGYVALLAHRRNIALRRVHRPRPNRAPATAASAPAPARRVALATALDARS